jgi:hypothetical protein
LFAISDWLPGAGLSAVTGIGYALLAILVVLPGWLLSGRIRRESVRVLLRASILALALAPGIMVDPGGTAHIAPALWATLYYALIGYAVETFQLGWGPLLGSWLVGAAVAAGFLCFRKKEPVASP